MGWLVCVWLASLTEQKIAVVGWTLSCLSPPADPRTLIDSILGHHISELNTYNHSQTHFLPPVPQQPLPWLFILITVCKSYQYKVTPSLTHSHILTHLSLCIGDGGGPMEYDNPMINMTIGWLPQYNLFPVTSTIAQCHLSRQVRVQRSNLGHRFDKLLPFARPPCHLLYSQMSTFR